MKRTVDTARSPHRKAETAMFYRPDRAMRIWNAALDRLPRLLALLIAMQVTAIFKDFWWRETFEIVYAGIWAAAVTELAIGRHAVLRFVLQTFVVVWATVVYTPFEWHGWPDTWPSWEEIAAFAQVHGIQFMPYVPIALSVLLSARLVACWATGRRHVLAVILLSVVLMAALDSFFPLLLWPNIAATVGIGLVWLVLLHFRQLRDRHFDSWKALAERPVELMLQAGSVIGLVLLVGASMPRAPALLEDPYTLFLISQGREVPTFHGEAGVLTNPLFLPAASSQSGYSRNDAEIGGKFEYDFTPVMEITTTHRSYWRGETKAVYTGRGWVDAPDPELMHVGLPGESGGIPLPLPQSRENASVEIVEQTVTILRDEPIPVLFGAGPVVSLQTLESGTQRGPAWNAEEWELVFSRPTRVQKYSIVSETLLLDEEGLRQTTARPAGDPGNLASYLQLPDDLPDRVRQLAQEVTAGAVSDYDRAKLLETYLKENYPYTNTPDLSRQRSRDVADAFLFEIREGYCDYYSTAFVVMARSIGLPARWVKGYATGFDPAAAELFQLSQGEYIPDLSGAGTYIVRNADAHSWAEVYFEGFGWVPFEPTAGFSMPLRMLPTEESGETEPVSVDVSGSFETPGENSATGGNFAPAAIAIAAGTVLLALAAWFGWRHRERLAALWNRLRHRGAAPNDRIVMEMHRFIRFMRRKGLRRERHETMRETIGRWGAAFGDLRGELDQVLLQFEAALYGPAAGSEENYREFAERIRNLRKLMK